MGWIFLRTEYPALFYVTFQAFVTLAEHNGRLLRWGKSGRHRVGSLMFDLLIVDKLGYMPIDTQRGNLFFQLVSRRYEKGSIILSTNKPFDRWGEMFGDDVIASAILDRLLHHCHIKDKLNKLKKED